MQRLADVTVNYVPADPNTSEALSDVALRKHSRDLEDLGCTYVADVRLEPNFDITSRQRLFLLPDQTGYFSVVSVSQIEHARFFPNRCMFVVRTEFTSGERLVSVTDVAGYRNQIVANVIGHMYLHCDDAAAMLAHHRKALRRLCEHGREAVKMKAEDVVAHLIRQEAEFRDSLKRAGYYTWAAAFRQESELVHPAWQDQES